MQGLCLKLETCIDLFGCCEKRRAFAYSAGQFTISFVLLDWAKEFIDFTKSFFYARLKISKVSIQLQDPDWICRCHFRGIFADSQRHDHFYMLSVDWDCIIADEILNDR